MNKEDLKKLSILDIVNSYRKSIGDKKFFEELDEIGQLPLDDFEELLSKSIDEFGSGRGKKMQEITLKSLISWVKQNFPVKIIDEVSGAEVEVGKNKELQEKLHQLKEDIEGGIRQLQDMTGRDDYWEGSLDTYREILGEEK